MTSQPQPDESGAYPVEAQIPKTRKALSRVKRELSEEDLATPGVQKMLTRFYLMTPHCYRIMRATPR
jgi:hypothetical protein